MTSDGGARAEAAAGEAARPPRRAALPVKKRKSLLLDARPDDSAREGEEARNAEKKRRVEGESRAEGRPAEALQEGCGEGHAKDGTAAHRGSGGREGTNCGPHGSRGMSPQINDVLMDLPPQQSANGPSPPPSKPPNHHGPTAAFHHIGNRRFRVLVEANLARYFGDAFAEGEWEAALSEPSSEGAILARERVVRSVIESVEGNRPGGRFLVRTADGEGGSDGESEDAKMNGHRNDGRGDDKSSETPAGTDLGSHWRLAAREEVEAKVHATFLAAGRFRAKGAAALARAAREAEQVKMNEAAAAGGEREEGGSNGDADEAPPAGDEKNMDAEPPNDDAETDAGKSSGKTPEGASGKGDNDNDVAEARAQYCARSHRRATLKRLEGAAAALREALLAGIRAGNSGARDGTTATSVDRDAKAETEAAPADSEEGVRASEGALREALVAALDRSEPNGAGAGRVPRGSLHGVPSRAAETEVLAGASARVGAPLSKKEAPRREAETSRPARGAPRSSGREPPGGRPPPSSASSVPNSIVGDPFARAGATSATARPSPRVSAPDLASIATDDAPLRDAAPPPLPCPPRMRVFLALPMERFFVVGDEGGPTGGGVPGAASPSVGPSEGSAGHLVPSNYDILCGPGRAFFHHVGNRRFRILVEMNARRYEEAYMASRGASASSGAAPAQDGGGGVVQKLIDEVLAALARCDPPGRFLGMDMSTGRWRAMNPVFAQLKVEQTFHECVRVGRLRRERERAERRVALQERALQDARREEWARTIERERGALLEELDRRMLSAGMSRGMSQSSSLSDGAGVAGAACPLRGASDPLTNEDQIALQALARATLQRRKAPLAFGASAAAAASASPEPAAEAEAMRRTSKPTPRSQPTEASRALLDRLKVYAATVGPRSRRNSLPELPLSSGPTGEGTATAAAMTAMSVRGLEPSCGSDRGEVGIGAGCVRHMVSSCSSSGGAGDDDNGHCVKDLMDVVGGMMMMARRGSC